MTDEKAPTADIICPMPGVFYTRASPEKRPFVQVGDRIEPGQTVGIVEVMKQFAEICSDFAGRVTSIPVEHGATVMPGDVLVVVESS